MGGSSHLLPFYLGSLQNFPDPLPLQIRREISNRLFPTLEDLSLRQLRGKFQFEKGSIVGVRS